MEKNVLCLEDYRTEKILGIIKYNIFSITTFLVLKMRMRPTLPSSHNDHMT